jgi:hypothetical protein
MGPHEPSVRSVRITDQPSIQLRRRDNDQPRTSRRTNAAPQLVFDSRRNWFISGRHDHSGPGAALAGIGQVRAVPLVRRLVGSGRRPLRYRCVTGFVRAPPLNRFAAARRLCGGHIAQQLVAVGHTPVGVDALHRWINEQLLGLGTIGRRERWERDRPQWRRHPQASHAEALPRQLVLVPEQIQISLQQAGRVGGLDLADRYRIAVRGDLSQIQAAILITRTRQEEQLDFGIHLRPLAVEGGGNECVRYGTGVGRGAVT